MLELAQQSRQPHGLHNPNTSAISARFEVAQHPGFQMLADRMHERLMNAHGDIDRDVFKRFCERMLPLTFQNWICKP